MLTYLIVTIGWLNKNGCQRRFQPPIFARFNDWSSWNYISLFIMDHRSYVPNCKPLIVFIFPPFISSVEAIEPLLISALVAASANLLGSLHCFLQLYLLLYFHSCFLSSHCLLSLCLFILHFLSWSVFLFVSSLRDLCVYIPLWLHMIHVVILHHAPVVVTLFWVSYWLTGSHFLPAESFPHYLRSDCVDNTNNY